MLTFGLLSSLLLLLLLSWEGTLVHGALPVEPITEINNASDLIKFANNVNKGSSYSGTTVVLWSDIVFDEESSGEFEPMGSDSTYRFQGLFDGQGHTISGLTMNSSSQYTGLFGYSNDGATIKNVVLSESCSVQSSYESTSNIEAYVGGIVGYCSSSETSLIENVVNMARVSFNGNATGNTLLGGIAGFLSGRVTVKNCANYGSITYSGTTRNHTSIGGIAGRTTGGGSLSVIIQNSLNYGTIVYNSKASSKDLYIGGIVGAGMGEYTIITNCLSAGRITSERNASENNYIGSIMGYTISVYVNVTYSHWTSETNCSDIFIGYSYSSKNPVVKTGTNSSRDDTKTLAFLNSQVESSEDEWSRWHILHMNGGEINGLAREVFIVTGNYIPTPSRENNTFLFWCKDTTCTAKYNTSKPGASDHLYAAWHMVTVKFISNGGESVESSKIVEYGSTYGDLPTATKEGCTFLGWYTGKTGGSLVKAGRNVVYPRDHNLYARWKANNYSATFDLGNGTSIERTFEFNSTIIFPEGDFTKEGYTFDGWNLSITIMPAKNITIAAKWRINNYSATFDLGNGTTIEKSFEFNSTIIFPEGDFTREGYTFDGWNKEIIVMPAKNITIAAKWIKNAELVEIVFEKKDLKEDEIRDIIERYVESTEYDIKVIEYNDEGEARVILKFRDVEQANNFITTIENTSASTKRLIKKVGFLDGPHVSLSWTLYPLLFNALLV